MKKLKRKTYLVRSRLSLDPILSACTLMLGVILIQTASHPDVWKLWIENTYVGLSLNKDLQVKGVVRYHKNGREAWQDLSSNIPLFDNDELSTGEDGEAVIALSHGASVLVSKDSFISLHANKEIGPPTLIGRIQNSDFYTLISGLLLGKSQPPPPAIQVKQGQIEVIVKEHSPSLSVQVLDKNFTLPAGSHWSATISGKEIHLGRTASRSLAAELEKEGSPLEPPQIINPLSGARFISSASEREDIGIYWEELEPDLEAEVELHRIDDPDFTIDLEPTSRGVVANLPDGHYSWRVRTINEKQHHSEWSPYRTFSVQENLLGAISIAVGQSTRIEKIDNKKNQAKEAEQARLAEVQILREREIINQQLLLKQKRERNRKLAAFKESQKLELERRIAHQKQKYRPIAEAASNRIDELLNKKQ